MKKGQKKMEKAEKDVAFLSVFALFVIISLIFVIAVSYGVILANNERLNEMGAASSFCQSQGYDGGTFFEEDTDFYTIDCVRFVEKEFCYGDTNQICTTKTIKETTLFYPTRKWAG
jgi:hypothetical protein